jgi:hypothetical protein
MRAVVVSALALAAVTAAGIAQQPAAPAAAAPAAAPQSAEYPGLETGKMWTFDVPPLEYWARRYSFRPTPEWLDHARLSTLRQPGCTASFVSGDGLVMTNHHCARACIEAATRQGEDLLSNGFYARTRSEERPCQRGMWVEQLLSISDVTDSVNAAIPATAVATRAAELRDSTIGALERRCRAVSPDLTCQVVTMYRGGQYKLYRFRRFSDVRLVFAPEDQLAFFGGDPDNFTFPRFDLDVSFYRVYVGDEPAHTEFFRWSGRGAAENDLVFVIGNPGSTGRLNTIAQLEYLRDTQYPATLAAYARQIAAYDSAGRVSPDRAASYRNTMFSLQNSQKAVTGYQSGLLDPMLMNRKRAWENEFRGRVNADPNLRRQYGNAWDAIAAIRRQMAALDTRRRYYAFSAYGSRLLNLAGLLARNAVEAPKPDAQRLPPFRDAARGRLDTLLQAPVDTVLERRLLTQYLAAMAAELPESDPVRRQALGGRAPDVAAREMIRASQILTVEQRRALLTGGAARVTASTDPFVALARVIEPLERDIQRQWTDLVGQEAQNDERIARALLAVYGSSVAPDATFSLRISDGEVRRYPYNGTLAQPFTTFYGLFDRHYGFAGQNPWHLPARWLQRRDSLNLSTPFNAVSTNDIIGGNSGSPVINRDGEIVGLIFDGNIEGLPARFLFTEARGRSVWVDARGIIESLRRVYDAGALADELTRGR